MRISVALCTYNGEKYIAEQLQSILGQTHPVQEIIVSDDGSSDNTLAIAEEILAGAPVDYKIQRNIPAKGVANNFLSALRQTTGDYVFTCDQDDIWLPEKVSVFMEYARKTPAELYFSDGILVDGNAQPLGSDLWQANGIRYEDLCAQPLMHTVVKHAVVTGAAMMVTKNLIAAVENIPEKWLHDEWFAIVAAVQDRAVAIPEKTFLYRQHGKNVVGANKKSLADRYRIWRKGFDDLHQYHQLRYQKCCDVAHAAKNSQYEELTQEACRFWKTLAALPEHGRWYGLRAATNALRCGQYNRFYSSYRSYIRDAVFVLLAEK